ncbi:MAG: L-seryl-tRNA(Sec) selenium transferase [Calditrichaeota bacterium]|nr:MAG: L-seryl-tRNA(Sec) selenium transferase [Calditrichota bacterium]
MTINPKVNFRFIPSVSSLLEETEIAQNPLAPQIKTELLRKIISEVKNLSILPDSKEKFTTLILDKFKAKFEILNSNPYPKVINGTGIILHTGLGRASYSEKAKEYLNETVKNYAQVEFDLKNGKRGDRQSEIKKILQILTGAESSLIVNNNAAAVLLILNTFAKNKETIISRGELVEIGGSFRMPEIMEMSQTKMIEVGATNKTHLKDYQKAISANTGLLTKIHTSNYRVLGFTKEVTLNEMVSLGKKKSIPTYYDLGSGLFFPPNEFGLSDEPTVQEILQSGVDLVSFSGDKAIGGSQSGIILGSKKLIEKLAKNPLMRTLRPCKLTLSVLAGTLQDILLGKDSFEKIPVLKMFNESNSVTKERVKRFLKLVKTSSSFKIVETELTAQSGSGAFPIQEIPSYGIEISSNKLSDEEIFHLLLENSIVGYRQNTKVVLNFKTIHEDELETLANSLSEI